jgi:SAM-dependent methyltransferase
VAQWDNAGDKCYGAGNPRVLSLVPETARTVLDVGCGTGQNAMHLHARGMIIDGVTLSTVEADAASAYCRHVHVWDLEQGLPSLGSDTYDVVICSHVLEHICFPSKVLRDIRKVLQPEGQLIVAIPNLLFYKNRLTLLRGKFEYQPSGIMDDTHFRWYTYASTQRLLERHGFQRLAAFAEGSFPIPFLRRHIPEPVVREIDQVASRMAPGLFGYQLLFVYELVK